MELDTHLRNGSGQAGREKIGAGSSGEKKRHAPALAVRANGRHLSKGAGDARRPALG